MVHVGVVGFEFECPLVARFGFCVIASHGVGSAQIVVDFVVFWVVLACALIRDNGAVDLTMCDIGDAQVEVGFGKVGLDGYGFLILCNGVGILTFSNIEIAQVVEGVKRIGTQGNDGFVFFDCEVDFAFVPIFFCLFKVDADLAFSAAEEQDS